MNETTKATQTYRIRVMFTETRCAVCASDAAGTCTGNLHKWEPVMVAFGGLFVPKQ